MSTSKNNGGIFGTVRSWGLQRTPNGWVGGVCAGLAARLKVDPLLVRGLCVIAVLLGGIGLFLYGIAWAFLPHAQDGRIHLEEVSRGNFTKGFFGAMGAMVIGLLDYDRWFSSESHPLGLGWALFFLIFLVIVVIAMNNTQGHDQQPETAPPPPPAGQPVSDAPTGGDATTGSPAASYPAASYPAGGYPTSAGAHPAAQPVPVGIPVNPPPTSPPAWGSGYTPPAASWAVPPQARPAKAGGVAFGIVAGLSIIVFAVALLAKHLGWIPTGAVTSAFAVSLIITGAAIIIVGLRGRTCGLVGMWAIILLVMMTLSAPFLIFESIPENDTTFNHSFTDSVVKLDTLSAATTGYSSDGGDIQVDLSELDLNGQTVTVPITQGVGALEILLPEGVNVTADVSVGAGSVDWDVNDDYRSVDGFGITEHYATEGVEDPDGTIHLEVDLGTGDLIINE